MVHTASAASQLAGHLTRVPPAGVRVGVRAVGDAVEIDVAGEARGARMMRTCVAGRAVLAPRARTDGEVGRARRRRSSPSAATSPTRASTSTTSSSAAPPSSAARALLVPSGARRVEVRADGWFTAYRDVAVPHAGRATVDVALRRVPETEPAE